MNTAVTSGKFTDPNMISERQLKMIVGGKVLDPSKPKGYQGYYGLINSKVIDLSAKVTDHESSPTYGWVLSYVPSTNQNGNPFRKWTNIFSLTKKQASLVISAMVDLPEKEERQQNTDSSNGAPSWGDAAPVVATQHAKVEVAAPASTPLQDGRYHLEGSNGYYVTVRTSEKNGRPYVNFSV